MNSKGSSKKSNRDSGLSGFLYEINFCAYLLCEAKERSEAKTNDTKRIEEFYISNNRSDVVAADDIGLKYGFVKDGKHQQHNILMQLKHTKDKVTLGALIDSGKLKEYHNDFRNEKLRSGSNSVVEIIHISISTLVHPRNQDTFIEKLDDECSFFNIKNGKNTHFKINIDLMVKTKKMEQTIMDVLNNHKECELFIEDFVNVLKNPEGNQEKYVDIFLACKKQLLKEIMDVTENGILTFKNEWMDKEENKKSPFEKCLLKRVSNCRDVHYKLPDNYCQDELCSGDKILPYTKQYFEEFLNAFKIYVEQPNYEQVKKLIENKIARRYMICNLTAENKAVVIISQVRDWWQKQGRVKCLDKSSEIIKESNEFKLIFRVKNPHVNFTGRNEELEEFHNLSATSSTLNIRVVHGLGGVGKSELIKRYIQVYGHCYQNKIFWIDAEDRSAITKSLQDLVDTTLTFLKKPKEDDDKTVELTQEIFNYFSDKNCLIVFDNVENDAYISEVLELITKAEIWKPHIIMTSRISTWDKPFVPFSLGVLKRKDAVEFVINGTNVKHIYNEDLNEVIMNSEKYRPISKLAETLQNLPLTLQHAISYIYNENEVKNFDEYTIDDYIKEFEEKELVDNIGFLELRDEYCRTTYKTVMISIDKIKSVGIYGSIAIRLLRLISFCAPINIDIGMFLKLSDLDEVSVDQGVGLLLKYSIMNKGGNKEGLDVINIHRLVQSIVRLNIEKEYLQKEDILQEALSVLGQNNTKHVLEHLLVTWKYAFLFEACIKKFGFLFKNILSVMYQESRFQEAEKFSILALESLQHHTPDDNKIIFDMKVERICLLRNLTKFSESIALCDELLTANINEDKKIFGEVMLFKGELLTIMSEYDEALTVYESIEPAEEDRLTSLNIRNGIAITYREKGEYGRALEIFNEILEYLERNKANEFDVDGYTWDVKNEAAKCHQCMGDFDKAEILFQEVLNQKRDHFGERSAFVTGILNKLSNVYVEQGKYEEALENLLKILEIDMDIYGEQSSVILATKHNIASIYLCMPERYEEGCKLCKEVAFTAKDLLGLRHLRTLESFCRYARILYFEEKYKEALEINEECYKAALDLFKNDKHYVALWFRSNIAKIYCAIGQTEKALDIARDILNVKMRNNDLGENHPNTLIEMCDVAVILANMGETTDELNFLYKLNETAPKYFTPNSILRRAVNKRIQKLESLISRNENQEFVDELPFGTSAHEYIYSYFSDYY